MNPTTGLFRRGTSTTVIALSLVWPVSAPAHQDASPTVTGSADARTVALTIECVDSAHIRFDLTNVGTTDTALRLGSAHSNGGKYTVDNLKLRLTAPGGQVTEWDYFPRDYPARIGGNLDDWFEALPVRASFRMSASAADFWPRQSTFPTGRQLSVRLVIQPPMTVPDRARLVTPKWEPLVRWTGTLTSNSCTVP